MAHCLYEKARLYDLCEAGLNFLKCHGSIYAEVFITRNRADRQVMLRGKRTGKNVSASGSESGSATTSHQSCFLAYVRLHPTYEAIA